MSPDESWHLDVAVVREARRRELADRVAADWETRRETWHATQFGTKKEET